MTVRDVIERFADATLQDEDGDALVLEAREPATAEELAAIEQRLGHALPGGLRELLSLSNGMSFFGVALLGCAVAPPHPWPSFAGYTEFLEAGLVPIHAWGNGDLDVLDVASARAAGTEPEVMFCEHGPGARTRVATSLESWLERVFEEVASEGALLHPSDVVARGAAVADSAESDESDASEEAEEDDAADDLPAAPRSYLYEGVRTAK